MNKNASGQLVVVTGSSTGIGLATASRLASAGFHVLAGVRRRADAERVSGLRIEPVILDVTDEQHLARLRERVENDPSGKPLRAVVNNAGIAINAPVEALSLADWRRQFEVAVFGQVAVIQALLPSLLSSRGRVVNIGSVGSRVAMPSFGAYSGAKYAMDAVSDALRREVASLGVKVVMVTPGAVKTSLTERGLEEADRAAAAMTEQQRSRYGPLLRAYRETVQGWARDGAEPAAVAAVVETAITAGRPRTRYTVGRDAGFMVPVSRLVPDRLLDQMVLGRMKLPHR